MPKSDFLPAPGDSLCTSMRSKLTEGQGIGERMQLEPDPVIWGTLSPREQEVFAMICDGLPDKEIARQLGLSARTIVVHAQRIIKKVEMVRALPHRTRGSLVATMCRTRAPLFGLAALSVRVSRNSVVSRETMESAA